MVQAKAAPSLQAFLFCEAVDREGYDLTIRHVIDYIAIGKDRVTITLAWFSSWAAMTPGGASMAVYSFADPKGIELFSRSIALHFDNPAQVIAYRDDVSLEVGEGLYSMKVSLDGREVGSFPLKVERIG